LMIPNAPGIVLPLTENSGVLSCMANHKEGIFRLKWGSLANIGCPLRVFSPDTAQLLEPVPSGGEGIDEARREVSGYAATEGGASTSRGTKSHFLEDSIIGSTSAG